MPAGNANDHYHSVHAGDFITAVTKGTAQTIDVLKLTGVHGAKPFERYAHSYIGLGLTPKVGKELNKRDLNRLNESWVTLKTIATLHHVRLKVHGRIKSYDSLVFTNVGRMAKVLNLAKEADVKDGLFEVSAIYHRNIVRLLLSLLQASIIGAQSIKQTKSFTFQTVSATAIQLDGEVRSLDAHTEATVKICHNALRCIV
jgi:diacylglycerol kinase (ATP)